MVIIYNSYNVSEVVDLATLESHRDGTVYCKAAEMKKVDKKKLDEGIKLYITDWKLLDDSKKSELVSRTHILDSTKNWLPM